MPRLEPGGEKEYFCCRLVCCYASLFKLAGVSPTDRLKSISICKDNCAGLWYHNDLSAVLESDESLKIAYIFNYQKCEL